MLKWTPTTKLASGEAYELPSGSGVRIICDQPGVTFFGGWVWPLQGTAISFTRGAMDGSVFGTKFSDPEPRPTNRGNRGSCIITDAPGTTVMDCNVSMVDDFVKAYPGADGTLLRRNLSDATLYAAFFYAAGARNTCLQYNEAADSLTENLVRFSPQLGVVPTGVTLEFNKLGNPGTKAVIELRSAIDVLVRKNELWGSVNSACIGVGRKSLLDGPGLRNAWIEDNTCHLGYIGVDAGAEDITLLANHADWPTYNPRGNTFITVDGKAGTLKNLTIRQNWGSSPVNQKPLVSYTNKERIQGLVDDGTNSWRT